MLNEAKQHLRHSAHLHVHVLPAENADALAADIAAKLHGTEPRDYSGAFLPGMCVQRQVARVLPPVAKNAGVYVAAVEQVVAEFGATDKIGKSLQAAGMDRVSWLDESGAPQESVIRVVEVLLN